jgi:hypothetical protein
VSEMRRTFQTLPAVVCRLATKRAVLVQETTKSGLAGVCTFDRRITSANVKVEIEDTRSLGFVIRRATDRSFTFANVNHQRS